MGIVDLINPQSRAWLQLVTFDEGKNVGIAAKAHPDDAKVLYSESRDLRVEDMLLICEAFMRSGDVATSGFAFSDSEWDERDDLVPSAPLAFVVAPPDTVAEPDDEPDCPELSPQDIVDEWIKASHHFDDEIVRLALSSGASLSTNTTTPALIHLAQCGAHPDVIDLVMSLGEDLAAVYDGGTALWHAVSTRHYAFADALLLRGADKAEARSSVHIRAWQKREVGQRILDDIARGDEHAVLAYLENRSPRHVALDLVVQAIKDERLAILVHLLAAKRELHLMRAGLESVWRLAMGLRDVRYVEALIKYGTYESVTSLPEYGRCCSLSASPETLSFLFSNGYKHDIRAMFSYLIRSRRDRSLALLPVFPNSYFIGLPPEHVGNALLSFSQHAPERIDHLLDHNDYAALLHYVFDGTGHPDGLILGPLILDGLGPIATQSSWREREPARVWEKYDELRALAGGLIDLDVPVVMPAYARKQRFKHARRQYEILNEAVRRGTIDEESIAYDVSTKFIDHGYASLTAAQQQVFHAHVAPIFANLTMRPSHWFLDPIQDRFVCE
ncbi:hypothetical protein [Massilia phyllosphaerae]|uniref:hypothetical protein n=1 Tax=Massilia phyllosphaerae TaxID=3106034 RepID=UPI002B1CDC75|nr:hypothetical protein [Massilia sp. SGZ-792]